MSSIDPDALANFTEGKPERVTASDRALLVVRGGCRLCAARSLPPSGGASIGWSPDGTRVRLRAGRRYTDGANRRGCRMSMARVGV